MNEIKRQLNARIGDTSERANRVQLQVNLKINQPQREKKVQWGYYAVIVAFIGVIVFTINLIPSSFNEGIGNLTKQPNPTETLLPPFEEKDEGVIVSNEDDEDNVLQPPFKYEAKNEEKLSLDDSEMAYEMGVSALTDYYKATRNGSDIELDTFIDNENLKQYIQKKIQNQSSYDSKVKNIEIGDWEIEYKDDVYGGFLYLMLPAHIKYYYDGGFGEATEFLIRNVNGKLVIVDWYTGGKDTYDFIVRGENEIIDNPNIWNDPEWVKNLEEKQNKFSGSTR